MSRRARSTACPARSDMRWRKPWRLARRRLFGWYVRFTGVASSAARATLARRPAGEILQGCTTTRRNPAPSGAAGNARGSSGPAGNLRRAAGRYHTASAPMGDRSPPLTRDNKEIHRPLAPGREAGATVPEPRHGGLGAVASSGSRPVVAATNGVVGGRLGDGRPRRHQVFSTAVDVLWTSPDQEERAE